MSLLATVQQPSFIDHFGPNSLLALILCLFPAALSFRFTPVPYITKQVIDAVSPAALLTAAVFVGLGLHTDADDMIAESLCVAFAFGLALSATTRAHPLVRLAGVVQLAVAGAFIVFVLGALRPGPFEFEYPRARVIALFGAAFVFLAGFALSRSRWWRARGASAV